MRLDFFYEPGCGDCERVRSHVQPALSARFTGQYEWVDRDLNVASNFVALMAAGKRSGRETDSVVILQIDNRVLLAGVEEIETGAERALQDALTVQSAGEAVREGVVPAPAGAGKRGRMMMGAAGLLLVVALLILRRRRKLSQKAHSPGARG